MESTNGLWMSQLPFLLVHLWKSLSSLIPQSPGPQVELLGLPSAPFLQEVVAKAEILKIKPQKTSSKCCYKYPRKNSIIKCPLFLEASGRLVRLRSGTPFFVLASLLSWGWWLELAGPGMCSGQGSPVPQSPRFPLDLSAQLLPEEACNILFQAGKNRIARECKDWDNCSCFEKYRKDVATGGSKGLFLRVKPKPGSCWIQWWGPEIGAGPLTAPTAPAPQDTMVSTLLTVCALPGNVARVYESVNFHSKQRSERLWWVARSWYREVRSNFSLPQSGGNSILKPHGIVLPCVNDQETKGGLSFWASFT